MLDKYQKKAMDAISARKNLIVTGVAGTGKSYLLNELREKEERELAVTATTGIAALQIGGSTLHSFAGIKLGNGTAEQLIHNMSNFSKERIRNTSVLVIDEVSMIDAELFDKLNDIFKKVRKDKRFFGGIQLLLFGDFLQLPPVRPGEEPEFCFEADCWSDGMFEVVELKIVHRQDDKQFVDILNNIRLGKLSDEQHNILKGCTYSPEKVPRDAVPVVLCPTNRSADRINGQRMDELKTENVIFEAVTSGNEYKIASMMKAGNIPQKAVLKIGAQVMMMNNSLQNAGIVNGSTGKIIRFENGLPVVKFFDIEGEYIIEKGKWDAIDYDKDLKQKVDATIIQIPLRLAWAITIHKSQGMTIPYLYCRLSNVFCDAQVYVALSRAKSLDGLFLDGFNPDKITVNEKAANFYDAIKQ